MIDIDRICLGCMREKPTAGGECPYCGFDAENYKHESRWLPMTSILNGRYMLGKVLGEGGFGITYIGIDLNLQHRVAIKEYFPLGLVSREMTDVTRTSVSPLTGEKGEAYNSGLQKFMEEAQGVSQFDDLDGIVTVKDFFFENTTAYMVMEYLDGITLKEYLREQGGKISGEQALEYMKPILEALQKVHEAGMIHRDISPDNIILTKDGKIKLIDFGSARAFARDENQTFTIMLKHGYAPPEQYQSKGKQGPWTDVYGICATLYKMITGEIPPNAMDRYDEDTLKSFSELEVGMPVYMEQVIIEKGMALKAKDRWQSVEELYRYLYAFPIDCLLKEEADNRPKGGDIRWEFGAEPRLKKKEKPEEEFQSEEVKPEKDPAEDPSKDKKKQNEKKRTRSRIVAAAGAAVILAGIFAAGFYHNTAQKENESSVQKTENTELSTYIGCTAQEVCQDIDGLKMYIYEDEGMPGVKFLLKKDGLAFGGEYDYDSIDEFKKSGDTWSGEVSSITIAGTDSDYCIYGMQPETFSDKIKESSELKKNKSGKFSDTAGNILEYGKISNKQVKKEFVIAKDGDPELTLSAGKKS